MSVSKFLVSHPWEMNIFSDVENENKSNPTSISEIKLAWVGGHLVTSCPLPHMLSVDIQLSSLDKMKSVTSPFSLSYLLIFVSIAQYFWNNGEAIDLKR